LELGAAVLAALAGSVMASRYGRETDYGVSLGSMLASLVITLMLREPTHVRADAGQPKMEHYVTQSLTFLR